MIILSAERGPLLNPLLQMRKLRPREVCGFPKVTQLRPLSCHQPQGGCGGRRNRCSSSDSGDESQPFLGPRWMPDTVVRRSHLLTHLSEPHVSERKTAIAHPSAFCEHPVLTVCCPCESLQQPLGPFIICVYRGTERQRGRVTAQGH